MIDGVIDQLTPLWRFKHNHPGKHKNMFVFVYTFTQLRASTLSNQSGTSINTIPIWRLQRRGQHDA